MSAAAAPPRPPPPAAHTAPSLSTPPTAPSTTSLPSAPPQNPVTGTRRGTTASATATADSGTSTAAANGARRPGLVVHVPPSRRRTSSRTAHAPSEADSTQSRRSGPLSHPFDKLFVTYMIFVLGFTIGFLIGGPQPPQNIRIWLITNAVLSVLRMSGLLSLHALPHHRLLRVRTVVVWAIRSVNLCTVAWYITGIIFLRRRSAGDAVTPAHKLMIAIIVVELSFLSLSILLGLFIFLFALRPVLMHSGPGMSGASKDDLSKLPTMRYKPALGLTEPCAICLCDYETDDLLKRLPCTAGVHVFHAACVDEWLSHNLSCPICREDPLAAVSPSATHISEVSGESDSPV